MTKEGSAISVDPAGATEPRAVILVEGMSDRAALEAPARQRGQALDALGISIIAMGGATKIERFLGRFGPRGLDVRLAGLCDAAEEGHFRRALPRSRAAARTGSSAGSGGPGRAERASTRACWWTRLTPAVSPGRLTGSSHTPRPRVTPITERKSENGQNRAIA